MKTVAIIANAAQLAIILTIFFVRGFEMDFWAIVLLALLIIVPAISFLAFCFARQSVLKADVTGDNDGAPIKRSAIRVRYPHGRGAVLAIGDAALSVIDLSEFGVRALAGRKTPFTESETGTIRLKSGAKIAFRGTVMRRNDAEVVFQFSDPIGTAVILEENKAIKDTIHE